MLMVIISLRSFN